MILFAVCLLHEIVASQSWGWNPFIASVSLAPNTELGTKVGTQISMQTNDWIAEGRKDGRKKGKKEGKKSLKGEN